MTREERQKYLEEKRKKETLESSSKSPEQVQSEKQALDEAIKNRKTKYNRATGKLEIIN